MSKAHELELKKLTEEQHKIHTPDQSIVEKVDSYFDYSFQKVLWYTIIRNKATSSPMTENSISYKFNSCYQFILSSFIREMTPEISVKEEYRETVRICWPTNLANNTILQAVFRIGDIEVSSLDRVWLDFSLNIFAKPNFRKHIRYCNGNRKSLTEWTTFLPSEPLQVPQPFFYSADSTLAFRLHFFPTTSKVSQDYTFRLNVADLLRMQVFRDGRWIDLETVDFSCLNISPGAKFAQPDLWVNYSCITPLEIDYQQNCHDNVFYINDVGVCDSTPSKYGQSVSIPLNSNHQMRAFIFAAENLNSSKIRNFSNYTTNTFNKEEGYFPIEKLSLFYTETPEKRFENLPIDHFYMTEYLNYFPSPPIDKGIGAHAISIHPNNIDIDVAIVPASLKPILFLDMKNTDPYEGKVDRDEERIQDPDFIVHVRLLLSKRLVIRKKDDGTYEVDI